MNKKIISMVFLCLLAFAVAGCRAADSGEGSTAVATQEMHSGETSINRDEITGSGTEEDPWLIGAESRSDVRAYIVDTIMVVEGSGAMMDFSSEDACPWHENAGDIEMLSIFADVTRIGANAFRGMGRNTDSLSVYFDSTLEEIGESAFEEAQLTWYDIQTFPESLKKIGNRAFAGTAMDKAEFYSHPYIAEDAFEGVTAEFTYLPDAWDEASLSDYGGTISWRKLLRLQYEEDYQTDDISGTGEMRIPEGEQFYYDAEAYCADESYHFDHYEVVEGNLVIKDVTDPVLDVILTEDVRIRIVYAKTE